MTKTNGKKEVDLSYLERPYWTEREFAHYLNLSPGTLSKSRMNGVLLGRAAPESIKIGRSVRYAKATSEKWVADNAEK